MKAKEANSLAKSKKNDNTNAQYDSIIDSIIDGIKKKALNGHMSVTYGLTPNCDYTFIGRKLVELGYKVILTNNSIKIDWSEPK